MSEAVMLTQHAETGTFMKGLNIFWKVLENQYQIQEFLDARIIFNLYDLGRSLDGTGRNPEKCVFAVFSNRVYF